MSFSFQNILFKELFYIRKKLFLVPFYQENLKCFNFPLEVSSDVFLSYQSKKNLLVFKSSFGLFNYKIPNFILIECFSQKKTSVFLPNINCFSCAENKLLFLHTNKSNLTFNKVLSVKRDLLLGINNITKNQRIFLKLVGTGYRAWLCHKENYSFICLKVGFCEVVTLRIPKDIYIWCKEPSAIVVFGLNNFLVGSFSMRLKGLRKIEFYKGTGIINYNQKVLLKTGKKRV